MIELACRNSGGAVELAAWWQGAALWNHVEVPKVNDDSTEDTETERLPHRPDAFFALRSPSAPDEKQYRFFLYEADRKRTNTTRFKRKLRAHFHFLAKQKRQREVYKVQRIRAVLVETVDAEWANYLRVAARDPIVSGPKASDLFWFIPSTIFTQEVVRDDFHRGPRYLVEPEVVFAPQWASPLHKSGDRLHSLLD